MATSSITEHFLMAMHFMVPLLLKTAAAKTGALRYTVSDV
jgi:hypothetical protein